MIAASGSTVANAGTITGGAGAAGGASRNSANGAAGLGEVGVSGADLTVANTGTITGGLSGATAAVQADAIDFTGGTNSLDLSTGTLSGNVGVDGTATSLNFVQGAAATLANVITGTGRVIDGGAGILTLSGANTYTGSTTLAAGTLDLAGATVLTNGAIASAAAGTGAVAFATPANGTTETLRIEQAALGTDVDKTFANAVTGFTQAGEAIDLAGGGLGRTTAYANGLLTVTNDAGAVVGSVKVAAAPMGERYVATADGAGGTDVLLAPTAMQTSFTVSNATQLNQAIADIDVGGADADATGQTAYTINFAQGFTSGATDGSANALTQQLYAVNLTDGDSLAIAGGSATLDGGSTYNGFFVYNGTVAISNLTIQNAVAQGGASEIGGGGAGLGGGLFVAGPNATGLAAGSPTTQGGDVTLTDVTFSGDAATGGSATGNAIGGGGLDGGAGSGDTGGGVGLGATGRNGGGAGGAGILLGAASGGTANGNGTAGADGGGGGGFGDGRGDGGGGVNGTTSATGGFSGGFGGGGSRGGVGGGGLGAGADVFVEAGGRLTVAGTGTLGAGTVTGGGGLGGSSTAGAAFGSGLFLQGDQSVTLAPGMGQTLTVAGVIADESESTAQLAAR